VQQDNFVIDRQWNIADAIIIATASYSYSECYDAMVSLNDVLAPHNLGWIYSKCFDKVSEAIFDGVVMLE